MDERLTWTDCDEAGDYAMPNVLCPRDLVSRPDNMDETVLHTQLVFLLSITRNYVVTGVSSSSWCLGWAALFYCGTRWASHIIISMPTKECPNLLLC